MKLREFILTYISSSTEIYIARKDESVYFIPSEKQGEKRTEVKLYENKGVIKLTPIHDDALTDYLLSSTKFKISGSSEYAIIISLIEK